MTSSSSNNLEEVVPDQTDKRDQDQGQIVADLKLLQSKRIAYGSHIHENRQEQDRSTNDPR